MQHNTNSHRHILVGTNGSFGSGEAVEVGISIAASRRADVTFLHVIPHVNGTAPTDDPALREAEELARQRGVPAALELAEGDAAEAILARGDALGADLIVVGPSGRNPFKSHVAAAVSMRALRPVIIARGTRIRAAA
jgi:nucleotide-binding universal stress UspA family protein